MKKLDTTLFKVIFIILAFLAASYSSYLSIKNEFGSSICNINDTFSCANVNESEYSKFIGIPIAYFGVLLMIFNILFLLFNHHPKFKSLREKLPWVFTVGLSLNTIATLGSFVLLFLQFFIIKSICIFCLAFDISIIAFTVMLYIDFLRTEDKK